MADILKKTTGRVMEMVSEKTVPRESRLWAALCYIIVVLIPLIILVTDKKRDRFVAFHAFQSIMLLAAAFVYSIVLSVLAMVLESIMPVLGLVLLPLYLLALYLFLAYAWKAYRGQKPMFPMTGKYALKLAK
jgi:uncharacterized membrane protein